MALALHQAMNTTTQTGCSCGCTEAHVVARRKTFDDITVQIWSDGAVTCGLNTYVIRGSRGYKVRNALRAAWMVADVVSLYDHAELRRLCVSARQAAEQPSLQPRAYLDAVMAGVEVPGDPRKGAVIRHATDCTCARCIAHRAFNKARPESERCYRDGPLDKRRYVAFIRVR